MAGGATPTSSAGHPSAGANTTSKLTFKSDHQSGAGQSYLTTSRGNHSKENIVSPQRHEQHGTNSINCRCSLERYVIDLRRIGDLRETPAFEQRPACRGVRCWIAMPQHFGEFIRCPVHRDHVHTLAVIEFESSMIDAAKTHRFFEHCVEHRREIAGRRIDDLQYFGGRGLLLQCLARLGDESRVLNCDDCLLREVFE